jgi:hypothetical protein
MNRNGRRLTRTRSPGPERSLTNPTTVKVTQGMMPPYEGYLSEKHPNSADQKWLKT